MKKLLAIFLCLCLLMPAMGLSMVSAVADEGGYVLADVGYRANQTTTYKIVAAGSFDAIDLTQYGFPTDGSLPPAGKLGLQFDLYITGEDDNSGIANRGVMDGQIEMTSSGTCDKEEIMAWANNWRFKWKEWNRLVLDLSLFVEKSGGAFDPTSFCYFRTYFWPINGNNTAYTVKICNVKLVDLTKADKAPSLEEDPLGDGSFMAEAPVWEVMDVPAGYSNDETIVAGYNLKEYVEAHRDVPEIQQCLRKDDYAPIIQSLLDGLYLAGGGALYIPSGVYPCRSEVIMKNGTVIYGDWKNPDENPEIGGTVLAVYAGEGSVNGLPFISVGSYGMLKYLNFWYPEQGYKNDTVVPYSATIGYVGSYCWVESCTLVNPYIGIRVGPAYVGSPNAKNIYGTPMGQGMIYDFTIDYARMENFHFSPKYWINSALDGAPVTEAERGTLENYLYWNATGVSIGRIDWSLLMHIYVEGYSAGVVMGELAGGTANGQNTEIHVKDCKVGLSVNRGNICGEMITNSSFLGCEYGVWVSERETDVATDETMQLINVEIEADEYAIYNQQGITVQVLSSTIKSGAVVADYGWYNIVNTTFEGEAPHVVLESGAISANLVGCRTASGSAVVIENQAFCPVINDPETAPAPEVATFTKEEALSQDRRVDGENFYLVTDLKNDGTADVTAALQAKLNTAKEAGGGVVYLINGNYLVNGTVTIPTGVELRGSLDVGTVATDGMGTYFSVTRTTDLAEPTFIMEAGSGARGFGFDYPNQGFDEGFKRGTFTQFPAAIQGRGSDIYIINVNSHNGWDGLDLMTYRCDNHYVDYFGGFCLGNFIRVGGGSENGIIRNYHMNPNAIRSLYTPGKAYSDSFETVRYRYTQNNTVAIVIGDVTNEFFLNSHNYSGYAGMQFVAEESGAADARVVGLASDYSTICVDVQQAEHLRFLNLQMVSYNDTGLIGSASALKKEMYHIRLGAENTGTMDVSGVIFWQNSNAYVNVQGGTLNLYGMHDLSSIKTFAVITENGRVNATAVQLKNESLSFLADAPENLHFYSGYYEKVGGTAHMVGDFQNMQEQRTWWDFPTDKVELPLTNEVLFAESFSNGYNFQTMSKAVVGDAAASIRSGQLKLELNSGNSAGVNTVIKNMKTDYAGALYRLETRVNVSNLPAGGMLTLTITGSSGDLITPFTFSESGFMTTDEYGDSVWLASFETGANTWYRVQVWLDMRAEGNKTCKVILLKDNGTEIAASDAYLLPEDMQEKNTYFADLYMGLMDFTPETDAASGAAASIDYLFLSHDTGTFGDVNDDSKIDSTDARMTLQYFVGAIGESDLNMTAADVDGNGKVDSTDARLILQYFVGAITEFPAA